MGNRTSTAIFIFPAVVLTVVIIVGASLFMLRKRRRLETKAQEQSIEQHKEAHEGNKRREATEEEVAGVLQEVKKAYPDANIVAGRTARNLSDAKQQQLKLLGHRIDAARKENEGHDTAASLKQVDQHTKLSLEYNILPAYGAVDLV